MKHARTSCHFDHRRHPVILANAPPCHSDERREEESLRPCPAGQSVELAAEADSTAGDLLNLAALLTLKNGGSVYAVEPVQVPGEGTLAAVLRW